MFGDGTEDADGGGEEQVVNVRIWFARCQCVVAVAMECHFWHSIVHKSSSACMAQHEQFLGLETSIPQFLLPNLNHIMPLL